MAFFGKNQGGQSNAAIQVPILDQWIKSVRGDGTGGLGGLGSGAEPGVNLPATTTGRIFRVFGGKVLIRGLVGIVTTAIQAQADNVKVSAQQLSNAGATVGSAVDVTANVDVTGLEVGGHYFVEGDGTAGVLSNAGLVLIGTNSGMWIAEQGQIYVTASATNTGKVRWECFWQPLDKGAYVAPEALSNGILQAKI
jgi:hypothetical protein